MSAGPGRYLKYLDWCGGQQYYKYNYQCPAGSYCPGHEKVPCTSVTANSSATLGLESCATKWGSSAITSSAGTSDPLMCYVNLDPGKVFYLEQDSNGAWTGTGPLTVESGDGYAPGGRYPITSVNAECGDYDGCIDDGWATLGIQACPDGFGADIGATTIQQCEKDGVPYGTDFTINLSYDTSKCYLSQTLGTETTMKERYGIMYYVLNNPNNNLGQMPFTICNDGRVFKGWYDFPHGGTEISGKDYKLPSTTLFTGDTTIYAQYDMCQSGSDYSNGKYSSCPSGYYCPGQSEGEKYAGVSACAIKCPTNKPIAEYASELADCHAACPQYTHWSNVENRCVGNEFRISFDVGYEDGLSYTDSVFEHYGEYFSPDKFPVPRYHIDGWYTDRNCGGTRVTDAWTSASAPSSTPVVNVLVEPTFFTSDATLYQCHINDCQVGKYFEPGSYTAETCPAGSYCPGTGYYKVPLGGCNEPCPVGMTSPAGSTSESACVSKCEQHYVWDEFLGECVGEASVATFHPDPDGMGEIVYPVSGTYAGAMLQEVYNTRFDLIMFYTGTGGNQLNNVTYAPTVEYYNGDQFKGWYSQKYGKGTRVTDSTGKILIEPTTLLEQGITDLYPDHTAPCTGYTHWNDFTESCTGNLYKVMPMFDQDIPYTATLSIYHPDEFYFVEQYGTGWSLAIDGKIVGTIDRFPIIRYTSEPASRVQFKGWYSESGCQGTALTEPHPTDMSTVTTPDPTTFTSDKSPIYACFHITCAPGEYYSGDGYECTQCPAGSYCPGGFYDVDSGKSQGATKCAIGSFSAAGAAECTACGDGANWGKTTNGVGATSCSVACTNTPAASAHGWANATWNADDNTVTNLCVVNSCAAGYYMDSANNKCSACNTVANGLYPYSANGTTKGPEACFARRRELNGYYIANAGDTEKTPCPVGQYTNYQSDDSVVHYGETYHCTTCPANTYADATGTSVCSACPTGYTATMSGPSHHDNVNDCTKYCPAGSWIATSGAAECSDVGIGYWSAADTVPYGTVGTRNACPVGETTIGFGLGADEASDCGRILHVGDTKLYLRSDKKTERALTFDVSGKKYYANLSTTPLNISAGITRKLHIGDYYAYDDMVNYVAPSETGLQYDATIGAKSITPASPSASVGVTEWGATFDYGSISGVSSCNADVGTAQTVDATKNFDVGGSGTQCWCKMMTPAQSGWMYFTNLGTACGDKCAFICANNIKNASAGVTVRTNLYSSAGILKP